MNHRSIYIIVALCFLCSIAGIASIAGAAPAATTRVYLPLIVRGDTALSAQEQAIFDQINQVRVSAGCPVLTLSIKLLSSARSQSSDMALRDFFSHNNPDGLSAINRAQANGYPNSYVGENLGAGRADASAMLSDWMKSPAHMANITNCQYTETGIGYYDQADDQNNVRLFNGSTGGPYRYYWTQVFGNPNL